MIFDPIKSNEWDSKGSFLEEGKAKFKIVDFEEALTRAGDPMMIVTFSAKQMNAAGRIRDYIPAKARFKIIGLCKAIGDESIVKNATNGILNGPDIINKTGEFDLKKEEYVNKNGEKKTALKVGLYIEKEDTDETADDFNDPLPF